MAEHPGSAGDTKKILALESRLRANSVGCTNILSLLWSLHIDQGFTEQELWKKTTAELLTPFSLFFRV